ncbi:hypothetical protein [Paraburkholderia caballeronis]|uniref:hypothetical protein n=1 Tax=Paraburkholderia caballeronis TaxID=416943 RepID=UPI00106518BD|nr:hypothetical protein [Paraburkholderia caballeronis]
MTEKIEYLTQRIEQLENERRVLDFVLTMLIGYLDGAQVLNAQDFVNHLETMRQSHRLLKRRPLLSKESDELLQGFLGVLVGIPGRSRDTGLPPV